MRSTFLRIGILRITVLLVAAVALAWGGWTVAAAHGGGSHSHGHGHGHHAIEQLIEALELDQDQQARLDEIHRLMASHHGDGPAAHLHALVEGVHRGGLDAASVRVEIDEHIEAMRQNAYRFADAAIALIESFDGRQREVLDRHLEHARALHQRHGADHDE